MVHTSANIKCRLPFLAERHVPGLLLFFLLLLLTSCIREEELFTRNTAQGNFEAAWTIIDRQYCFFDYKGIDWDSVHSVYAERAAAAPDRDALFETLCDMLAELRDGHVNLTTAADMGRYWAWKDDYPRNFDPNLQLQYLGKDYHIAGSLCYRMLDDNIAYIVCNSFSYGFSDSNLDYVMARLIQADGMIVDVRDNSGGNLTYAASLASRFTNKRRLVGYNTFKNGSGHNDFSRPQPEYLDPSKGFRWQKPVVLLTNRSCYSATNTFVRDMRCCPNVTVMGDRTGGGSGLPFVSELPNGWLLRFSTSPMLDADMQHIEFGIDPDIFCPLDTAQAHQGRDSMIESARQYLHQ